MHDVTPFLGGKATTNVVGTDHYRVVVKDAPPGLAFMEKLEVFFSNHPDDMRAIYNCPDDQGIREMWLQGELFLWDREHIRMNEAVIGNKLKADLSYFHAGAGGKDRDCNMIAEIKWISTGSVGATAYWDKVNKRKKGEKGNVKKDLERLSSSSYHGKNILHLMIVVIGLATPAEDNRQIKKLDKLKTMFLKGKPSVKQELDFNEIEGIGPTDGSIRIRVWRVLPPKVESSSHAGTGGSRSLA